MSHLNDTQFVHISGNGETEPAPRSFSAAEVLEEVYAALKEKGYNPVTQIVGYIMSGDPTYITNYQGARALVMKVERDELLTELVENYIKTVL